MVAGRKVVGHYWRSTPETYVELVDVVIPGTRANLINTLGPI